MHLRKRARSAAGSAPRLRRIARAHPSARRRRISRPSPPRPRAVHGRLGFRTVRCPAARCAGAKSLPPLLSCTAAAFSECARQGGGAGGDDCQRADARRRGEERSPRHGTASAAPALVAPGQARARRARPRSKGRTSRETSASRSRPSAWVACSSRTTKARARSSPRGRSWSRVFSTAPTRRASRPGPTATSSRASWPTGPERARRTSSPCAPTASRPTLTSRRLATTHARDAAVAVYRAHGHSGPRRPNELTPSFSSAGREGAVRDYLVRVVNPAGKYVYMYRAAEDHDDTSYGWLRHAGTTYALFEAYDEFRGSPWAGVYVEKGELALSYLKAHLVDRRGQPGQVRPRHERRGAAEDGRCGPRAARFRQARRRDGQAHRARDHAGARSIHHEAAVRRRAFPRERRRRRRKQEAQTRADLLPRGGHAGPASASTCGRPAAGLRRCRAQGARGAGTGSPMCATRTSRWTTRSTTTGWSTSSMSSTG